MSDHPETPPSIARGAAVSAASGGLRGFAAYGVVRVLVEALLGLRGLVLASILGPEIFGVWAVFRVIMEYCAAVGMGLLRGLEREASAPLAGVANARAESAATALGFMLLAFGGLSVVAALVAGLNSGHWLAPALAAVAGGLVLDGLWRYSTTYLRATAELWRLARCELISAVLQIALVVALAWKWGLEGALLGFVLATAAVILLLLGRVPMRPAFSLSRLRSLLYTGFPIGVTLVLMTSLASVDRVVVGALAGAEALGYYAFAVSVSSLGAVVAFVLLTQVFPDVYRDAQARGALPATEAYMRGTMAPFTWLLSPVLGALALMLDPVVQFLAPEYESAVPAARIFLFTGVVTGLANLATLGAVAANRQWQLPGLAASAVVLNLLLAVAALAAGLRLEWLAAAVLAGRTAYASGIVVVAARGSGVTGWPILLARTLLPLVWCVIVADVLGHLLPMAGGMAAVTAVVLYPLALLPLVPFGRVALRESRGDATFKVGS